MVNRELIEVFSEIAREKNVERSELATILEELFLYVIEKEYGDSSNCSCIVNLDKGEIEIYAEKTIVDEIDDYKVEILLEEAIRKEPDAADLEVGDIFTYELDQNITCSVKNQRKVEYQGEEYYLTGLTKKLMNTDRAIRGSKYWYHKGRNIVEIYNDTYATE